ncbi:K02A2.6-like [Cordylochernes scorpioides]|uniref:RNA-directed DNA polymerase n=1 Tax=Cordylochernes scorpioides TaxID=51811 RepID=A0ABY6KD94_9ARAC|nr:K02A2.6-like [Cordylochernes scorpioides]
MANYMQIAAPEGFNFGKPYEWPIWFKRFQRYRIASGLSEKRLFYRKRNVIYERAKFNRRSQEETEPVEEFITNLYVLAENCSYGILKEEMIRDRLVVGVKNINLSEKLQLESELTLEKAIQIVRQSESVKNQQKEIRQDTENRNVDVIDRKGGRNGTIFQKTRMKGTKTYNSNFPKNHQGWSSNEKRKCFRCGYYQGLSKEQCPAKDAICNKCRKKGHFSKVCHTKTIQEVSSSQNNAFIGIVGMQENAEDKWCEVIKVNDQPIKFKIDTGAEVSVMPEGIYLQHFGYLKTEKADKNIFAVSKKIEVNGMFQAFLESKRQKCEESIYIVRGVARPLLSCRASEILGLVRRINIVEDHAPTKLDPMLKCPKLFTGLGKIDIPYEIKLKEGAKPYSIYTPRRVPIPLMKELQMELERMTSNGVIEKVEGSSEWCSPMVLVAKPSGKLRICVDFSILNKNILREIHPIPVVEHTLAQLKGAKLFTKLDANSGFWQIPLSSESTLSETEKRYAQIEKEALAITWACKKFKQYIQGLVITLETDHKPLRLRLRIMRYSYKIVHPPGKNLIVADAQSRSPRMKVGTQELEEELCAYVQHVVSFMPISDVREGWPERTNVSMPESQYWPAKDDFSVENGILLKGSIYVIPENIRKGLLQRIHEGHLGIVKCRERAKGSVWWPRITSEIEEMVRTCPMCIEERTNRHQPLLPSELPNCPWEKVGVDLFTLKGQNYLLITDYYSRYPEIARLEDMTSASVIVHCKSIFARHGIPLEVRSDNGPQFGSLFKEFAHDNGFTHVTSSPRYPQSNGFIDSFVKIVKERISKSKDPYLALLAYRATPLANGFSPAELSMGRRVRTTIPTPTKQHQPPNLKNLKKQEAIQREKQKTTLIEQKEYENGLHWINRFHLLPTGQRSPGSPHFEPDEEPYINYPEANTHTSDAPTDVTDSSTSPKEALYRTRSGRTVRLALVQFSRTARALPMTHTQSEDPRVSRHVCLASDNQGKTASLQLHWTSVSGTPTEDNTQRRLNTHSPLE